MEHVGFYVVMSGAPGSGKSTLAAGLAERLSLPLLSYDVIKESLADTLGVGDSAWIERLTAAATEVFFAIAPSLGSAVLDHWWKDLGRERLVALGRPMVEVFCRCSDDRLVARTAGRAQQATRHPVHADWLPADVIGRWRAIPGALLPLQIGVPVLEVCTDAPVAVEPVAQWVEARQAEIPGRER